MNDYFEFPLTEELVDQIIFCMEDQSTEYTIDPKNGEILTAEKMGDRTAVPLPEWRSADGYLMMEKFISSLHNPIYKEELRQVMMVGKGVFRNFKRIVKSYDPLKKKWYNYKERYMKNLVTDWYEVNIEAGYFEKMGTETIETENIILSDFGFKYNCIENYGILDEERKSYLEIFPDDPVLGRYYFEKMKQVREDRDRHTVSVCAYTGNNDCAGILWGWLWSIPEETLLVVEEFFVQVQYRGLGLGQVLIQRLKENVRNEGVDRIFFEVPGNFPHINMMLEKQGFVPAGSSYSFSVDNLAVGRPN